MLEYKRLIAVFNKFKYLVDFITNLSVAGEQTHIGINAGSFFVEIAGADKKYVPAKAVIKGDKVIVFKKKRRKGYQKSNGHRQYLTKIRINELA